MKKTKKCCGGKTNCCTGKTKAKKSKKSKAFTLIEMLVVIVIIGILAAVLIYSVSGARQKANAAKAKGDIMQLKNVIEKLVSVDGCTAFTLATVGNALQVKCTPSGGSLTTYATIQSPSSPGNYSFTVGTNCAASTGTNQTWVVGTTTGCAALATNTYSLVGSGFSGGGSYTCDGSGCVCSAGACDTY